MPLPLDYLELLLIAAAALVFLLLLFLLRRRQVSRRSPLERALANSKIASNPEQQDLLMPLLVLEEQYPRFGEILALVIVRCGIRRLLRSPHFSEPARYLARAAFSSRHSPIRGALCHMVRGFLEDPDIEFSCRPELPPLVDEFIEEINQD